MRKDVQRPLYYTYDDETGDLTRKGPGRRGADAIDVRQFVKHGGDDPETDSGFWAVKLNVNAQKMEMAFAVAGHRAITVGRILREIRDDVAGYRKFKGWINRNAWMHYDHARKMIAFADKHDLEWMTEDWRQTLVKEGIKHGLAIGRILEKAHEAGEDIKLLTLETVEERIAEAARGRVEATSDLDEGVANKTMTATPMPMPATEILPPDDLDGIEDDHVRQAKPRQPRPASERPSDELVDKITKIINRATTGKHPSMPRGDLPVVFERLLDQQQLSIREIDGAPRIVLADESDYEREDPKGAWNFDAPVIEDKAA